MPRMSWHQQIFGHVNEEGARRGRRWANPVLKGKQKLWQSLLRDSQWEKEAWEATPHLENEKCAGIPQDGFLLSRGTSLGRIVRLGNEKPIKAMAARTWSTIPNWNQVSGAGKPEEVGEGAGTLNPPSPGGWTIWCAQGGTPSNQEPRTKFPKLCCLKPLPP